MVEDLSFYLYNMYAYIIYNIDLVCRKNMLLHNYLPNFLCAIHLALCVLCVLCVIGVFFEKPPPTHRGLAGVKGAL